MFDDVDKSASFTGNAPPRRSTESLGGRGKRYLNWNSSLGVSRHCGLRDLAFDSGIKGPRESNASAMALVEAPCRSADGIVMALVCKIRGFLVVGAMSPPSNWFERSAGCSFGGPRRSR